MTLNNMTPTIGSKFTLTELPEIVWEVVGISENFFSSCDACGNGEFSLHLNHASKLNWIKPEVKLSKEQAQRVKEIWNDTLGNPTGLTANKFKNEIDKITE